MRNIDKAIHEDEWIQSLDDQHLAAWLMMLHTMCDDQGRFEINIAKLRFCVFRSVIISDDEVEKIINNFALAKKVFLYEANGKKYCQVINWWKYQYLASYMSPSNFPAPEGWTDCWRYNDGVSKKPVPSDNWAERKTVGGFGLLTLASAMSSVNQPSSVSRS